MLRVFLSRNYKDERDDGIIRYALAKRFGKLNNAVILLDEGGAKICRTNIEQALDIAEQRKLKLVRVCI